MRVVPSSPEISIYSLISPLFCTHTMFSFITLLTLFNHVFHSDRSYTMRLFPIGCCSFRKPVLIDTDIFSDVDDVGSLAVANVLHNNGLADLRGVVINTPSKYGALATSVINTYFGNGDIPIGAMRPLTNETFFDDYSFR